VQLWWVHQAAEGSNKELWQTANTWPWMTPNDIRALWRVLLAESRILQIFARSGKRKQVRLRYTFFV
jgi:hypothetical protein